MITIFHVHITSDETTINSISVCAWWRLVDTLVNGEEVWEFRTPRPMEAEALLAQDATVIGYGIVVPDDRARWN